MNELLRDEFYQRTKQKADDELVNGVSDAMVEDLWASRNSMLNSMRVAKSRDKHNKVASESRDDTPPKLEVTTMKRETPATMKKETSDIAMKLETSDI